MPSVRSPLTDVVGIFGIAFILFYQPVSEFLTQRTLGKRLMGLKLVTTTGARPTILSILIRHLSRPLIGGLLWYFAFGTFWVHDIFSRTRVVYSSTPPPSKG